MGSILARSEGGAKRHAAARSAALEEAAAQRASEQEAAEQAEAAAQQRRRLCGAERVSDGLRVRGAVASSSAALSSEAAPAAVPEPKGSIAVFFKPKAEP